MIELIAAAGFGAAAIPVVRGWLRHEGPPTGSTASTDASGWVSMGHVPMVGSPGLDRWATYRTIYRTNPWIWAAVNKLARDLARYPIHVYELDVDGRRKRIRSDVPATPGRRSGGQDLDWILRHPQRVSRYANNLGTWIDRLVYGNAMWELLRDGGGGAPTGIRRERWKNVRWVDEGPDGLPRFYEVASGMNRPRRLAPDEVVHFGLGTDPESPVGVSPIEACKATVALHEAVVRHLLAYFENSARPSGTFQIEGALTEERAKQIRQLITDLYASPENAGKILVTSGKWQEMGHTPDHSKVVELIKLSQEEAATVYGVPPPMIGILDRAIKSNVKELREQYIREGIGPWASEFEGDIAAQLIIRAPSWRYLFAELQLAEALRPDLEARALVYQRLMHIYTIDEIREMENQQRLDIPGVTDVPWVQSGAKPVTAAAGPKPDQTQEESQ